MMRTDIKKLDKCFLDKIVLFTLVASVLPRPPKTVIGGIKYDIFFEKKALRYLIEELLILALPVMGSNSNMIG